MNAPQTVTITLTREDANYWHVRYVTTGKGAGHRLSEACRIAIGEKP